MLNEKTPEAEIAKRITQICLESKQAAVRGSHLGGILPDVRFRESYESLGKFISQYCADVEQVGKHGGDTLFAHTSRKHELISADQRKVDTENPLWRTLTNPRLPGSICVNIQTGEVMALAAKQEAPPGFVDVPRISVEDYRNIARTFLEDHKEIQDPRILNDLQEDGFWFPFANLVKTKYPESYSALLSSRVQTIWELFESRLREIGANEDTISRVRAKFRSVNAAPSSSTRQRSIPVVPTNSCRRI